MKINESWEIKADERSWKVRHITHGINSRTKKRGTHVDLTYHGSLSQACKYVLDNMPKKYMNDIKDIKDLQAVVARCNKMICKTIKNMPLQ
jgi:hypothetical protein